MESPDLLERFALVSKPGYFLLEIVTVLLKRSQAYPEPYGKYVDV